MLHCLADQLSLDMLIFMKLLQHRDDWTQHRLKCLAWSNLLNRSHNRIRALLYQWLFQIKPEPPSALSRSSAPLYAFVAASLKSSSACLIAAYYSVPYLAAFLPSSAAATRSLAPCLAYSIACSA